MACVNTYMNLTRMPESYPFVSTRFPFYKSCQYIMDSSNKPQIENILHVSPSDFVANPRTHMRDLL